VSGAADALAGLVELAGAGRLYPALILHGASEERRRAAAAELARALLCEREPAARPCGECRHCRRIVAPPIPARDEKERARQEREKERDPPPFHPDLGWLERDQKTVTSAEAARAALRAAHSSPFEARGQVFVVAEADTLSGEAGDALLKLLEEPGLGAPRHFLLLAPSRLDLSATLRSRSLAVYLGAAEAADEAKLAAIGESVAACVARFAAHGGGLDLLAAAAHLARAGDFKDPRAQAPWSHAAAALRSAAYAEATPPALRRALLDLAHDLLAEAPPLRLRGITAERILEGLVSRRLAG
jgi:DNA polymerase-3 subunit delta'